MSVWLIIIGAILVMVGSFAWIKPSKRDVRLANWRRLAIEQGLQVKIMSFEPDPKTTGIHESIEGTRYRWIDPKKVQEQESVLWAISTHKGWYNQGLPENWYWVHPITPHNEPSKETITAACNAIEALPLLANSTPLIQVNLGSRSIIWTEKNQSFDATRLVLFLKQLQAPKPT